MSNAPEIRKEVKWCTYYDKSFWVEVWQPEGGRAFVHTVEINELPPFPEPLEDDFAKIDEAIDAGIRFATVQIDN